jgi:hypothetical protein
VVRDGVVVEDVELETRSYLVHDLAHFAVEAEGGLDDGFWGHVARGVSFAALSPKSGAPAGDAVALMRAEKLAAPFQSLWHGRLERASYRDLAGVDDAFIDGALERMRKLMGHWKATPFHETMELAWPVTS